MQFSLKHLVLFLKGYIKNFSWGVLTLPLVTLAVYLFTELAVFLEITEFFGFASLGEFFMNLLKYFHEHPYRIFISASILGILLTNSILLWKSRVLLRSFGIFSFFNYLDVDDRDKNWNSISKKISESSTLFILGSTGYKTFKLKSSPLHGTIKDFQGNINILLLSPNAKNLEIRAATVGQKASDYKKEINESISYLRRLNKKKRRISLRTYTNEPDWKMVMSDSILWLQYYMPEKHVDEMPIYGIYSVENKNALYNVFLNEYIKKWKDAKKIEI